MNQPLAQVRFGRDTLAALDRIRAGEKNPLLGADPAIAESRLKALALPLLEQTGLPRLATLHYSWFLRELARLWRTLSGPDLAFYLELAIRKWAGYGLRPETLQLLLVEAFNRLNPDAAGISPPSGETARPHDC